MDEPAGPASGHLIRLWDVTAQVSAQRDMRTFQSMVMHKLRTPIGVVLMAAELMASAAPSLPAATLAELAKSALGGIERLRRDVEDVLMFIGMQDMARNSLGCDLALLPTMASTISAELKLRQVSVSGVGDCDKARLWLAETSLELVLREILENAKKFHPTHSPTVVVQITRPASVTVRLSIQDDGITIPPERLAQAWDPYYQGEKHFTGEVRGMGLGLPLVATIVWQVGGQCRLYNREDGAGVVVELTLPVQAD